MTRPAFSKLLALLIVSTVLTFAQQPTAQLTGLISDSSGAAIPGADLDVLNTSTGLHYSAISNDTGNFVFTSLPPGTYQIEIKKGGFQTSRRSNVSLSVGQVARLDFSLSVGSRTQIVEVTGAPPLLESDSASTGQVIGTKPINDLPLNGRNFLQLAKLTVGVAEPKPGDRASAGGSFIANGVRAQLNNFLLDGVDNNAKIVDQQNSSPVVIQPSVDALQAFKVETNNYSAEYGYSAGAVVNASLKSGTNTFHGDLFWFLRNDLLDARNFFADPKARKPVLQQNQFGGVIGGPIVRNRAFFFGSYERTSINRGNTYVSTIPTAAMRSGNFSGQPTIYDPNTTKSAGAGLFTRSAFVGNRIPADRFDPAAVRLLAALPAPTSSGSINNYVSSPTNTTRANRVDFKQDTQISQFDSLFARYSFFGGDQVTYGPFPAPIVGSTTFQTAPKSDLGNGAALGETHIFSPTLVNEARLGYNRIQDFLSPFVGTDVNSQFGLGGIPAQPGVTGLPSISVSGFATLGEATFLPNQKISEVITGEDHLSWTLGRHLLRFGGSYRWVRSWFSVSSNARGTYTFSGAFTQNPQNSSGTGSGAADLLLGIPANASVSTFINGDLRYNYGGAFIQDDWKITPKLTLNLGVRYELWSQPAERHDRQANFLTNLGKLVYAQNHTPAGVPSSIVAPIPDGLNSRTLMKADTNNLAPRLGFAYQAAHNTVIRAGAGVFFADQPAIGASARPVANPPFYQNSNYQTDQITPLLTLSGGFPANALNQTVNLTAATFSSFAADLKQAYVYHWSLDVQQQMHNYLFDVGYVGTKSNDLPLTYNINQASAGPGSVASRRPYQGLNDISFTSAMDTASYHALEARVEHRYTNGFSLLASYTFSRLIDIGGESLVGDLSLRDARNVKAERGLSSADQRHRFVASALYDLPFGNDRQWNLAHNRVANALLGNWQINGILTVRSGTPFTPTLGTSTANTGVARPNRIADGNLSSDQRSVNNWFDKTAFKAPTLYNFGNAGRDILIGPGAANVDASLFKSFRLPFIGEGGQLQFRAEVFNLLNHPQFSNPNTRVDIAQGGTITGLSNDMREIQFALKILF